MSVGVVNKQTGDRIPTAGIPAIDDALDLTSVNPVQNAVITAALANKQDKTDNNLDTDEKTIVGAINEHEGDIDSLKSGFTNLDNEVNGSSTTYPYADVITINDAVPANLAECKVKIEPVQDLHGYDKPWVGGAGKNKLPMTVDSIKTLNTTGTWSGNAYTVNNVTFTILTDNDNNVIGVNVNGTAGANVGFKLFQTDSVSAYDGMLLNGCPNDGSLSKYRIAAAGYNSGTFVKDYNNLGSDVELTLTEDNVDSFYVSITAFQGFNIQNIKFYPMLRLSTETDDTFAPYTNICPISGHTEAVVTREGVNLCPIAKVNTQNSNTFVLNAGTYTASFRMVGSGMYTTSSIILRDSNNTDICSIKAGGSGDVKNGQFTLQSKTTLHWYVNNVTTGTDGYYIDNIQLELGSTATPYEPYSGQQYTLALGDTIYGGTVDFETGVMRVTHKYIEYDGSNDEEWIYYTHRNCYAIPRPSDSGKYLYAETNQFEHGAEYSTITGEFYFGNDNLNINSVPMFATLSDWTTHLSSNPLQLCYELATPFTVQLTPQQIQLLQGANTLYASTGDISVTVNGVSGAIGAVQTQANDHEERIETVESGLTNLVKVATAEITTNAYGWLYFPQNCVVLGAYVGDYKNIPLFYNSGNNRYYSRLYLDATATSISYASFDTNTAYTVTYVYIDNE